MPPRPDAPTDPLDVFVEADVKDMGSVWRHFRGKVRIETPDMQLKADELDWNTETSYVEARGHVHFEHFARGEILDCDRAEYNLDDQTGNFYNVKGSATSRIQARPGLLTTTNPFYFEGEWAERIEDHYIVHNGFLTDCTMPQPWWILKSPKFIVIPRDHATTTHSWFYLKKIPLFYTPFFYKSLKKEPRKSGFLIPEVGNNSSHGQFVGFGYYWAINRSYDLQYRGQYYSNAGLANHLDFRGKVNQHTDFDLTLFGIKTSETTNGVSDEGLRLNLRAKSDLGHGWEARGELDYLSSLTFIQQYTQSFNEAVSSETHSVGFVTKHWSDFGVDIVAERDVNFQTTTPNDTIEIRKLPEANFLEREHEINIGNFPIWISFDSAAGLLDRSQPEYQTRQFVDRFDFGPQVTTAIRLWDFSLVPTFGIRETYYGSSFVNGVVSSDNVLRSSRQFSLDLVLPSFARIFDSPPKWMGEKVKHVIEPRVTYKYVTGITNFDRLIRFDETELLTNTNQVEFSLTNRILSKDKNGTVTDFITWQLWYDRYFNPTFGGAIVPGIRNVLQNEIDLTGYAFLTGPRHDSPIVSALRVQSKVGLEWRTDYDLDRYAYDLNGNRYDLHRRGGFVNSSVTLDGRIQQFYWSLGHTDVKADPVLLPQGANQFRASFIWGNSNRRGWNAGASVYYDIRQGQLQFWQTQVTKNTDCCGFSVQYRRFSVGSRDDSQIQVAFAVSNIGTFGTLKRQERVF